MTDDIDREEIHPKTALEKLETEAFLRPMLTDAQVDRLADQMVKRYDQGKYDALTEVLREMDRFEMSSDLKRWEFLVRRVVKMRTDLQIGPPVMHLKDTDREGFLG